jgi:predicted cupin superfamily sugar epimerase
LRYDTRVMSLHPDAEAVIRALGLEPHPEGGFYRETFRALLTVEGLPHVGGSRPSSTAIYYLLPAGAVSALHRVSSDEIWHHYDGDPIDIHTIDRSGLHAVTRIGRDLARGERPQHIVPAGTWQAAVPVGDRYALCGCTVSPGFDFADFEMPSRDELHAIFPLLGAVVEALARPDARDTVKLRLDGA